MAYNGFENGEINYKGSKGGFKEAEYGRSDFEENTDLEECQYQEKEEKVMMMVSTMMMMMSRMMVIMLMMMSDDYEDVDEGISGPNDLIVISFWSGFDQAKGIIFWPLY